MILAGGVMVVIIAVAIFALGGKGDQNDQGSNNQEPAKKATAASRESNTPSTGKAGKKPDRPAPTVDAAQMALARKYLKEGKALYNKAMADYKAGNGPINHAKLQDCKAVLDKGRHIFDDVTLWDEEATMEDWAYPGHLDVSLKLWGDLSKVYAKAHKISRAK